MEWKEPPKNPKSPDARASEHEAIANQLKQRPGQWALCYTDEYYLLAYKIKNGSIPQFRPAWTFEATCRGASDKSYKTQEIYVRYVGEVGV
jgi:hypothetical protein